MLRTFLMLASFFGFTGVALGAFAAHGLKNRLTPEYLAVFHTGVLYQLIHALAIFGVALLAMQIQGRLVTYAGISFTLGIILFSGSLYLMTLTGATKLGIITPFGGLFFLIGWAILGWTAWRLGLDTL
ncbi:DUF423 domain-containing protein [Pseudomonas sp. NPDC078416]|jgi:uncharacterized membrane protein YgdD (TMEM256/DUF423 family)|uniref:DUF423 domain-containing protein n=1 Tax=Pseudomonas graminis TaxID=158627 RepID=A0A1C2DMB4_9PSED|nr:MULTISPECIES: DUF423 domain-containing protein [Pseudomonas]PHX44545.1 hypothetical protein AO263_28245 [Pseudomonas sp. NZIPFR-PS5]MBD8600598.1 DUF423 domain-containing protein [Pseudomonas sp. CFBP 8772]MBD8707614.1 DUF423 domain-containing protein [Pseudomonas sp. CFBP 13711]MBD8713088.1 DUF423 domain-containing protein [Pseudomonas sp. CFBP 13715]MDC6381945.1 DUF423 domain-containing protein [Pseudomonas graminis]